MNPPNLANASRAALVPMHEALGSASDARERGTRVVATAHAYARAAVDRAVALARVHRAGWIARVCDVVAVVALVAVAAVGAVGAVGCDDETLRVLTARISLCPSADAVEGACDDTIDAGRLVVGAAHEVEVFIVNRGDGALLVRGGEIESALAGTSIDGVPERVAAGGAERAVVVVTPSALGSASATLSVTSSDDAKATATVTIVWEGIPPPRGDVLLCDAAVPEAPCAAEIDVDMGDVRATQTTSRLVLVRNGGETDLFVESLRIEGTDAADFAIASSTQSAALAPEEEGGIVIVFTGNGTGRRSAELVVVTDAPDAPEAIARLEGRVGDNLAPTALAVESVTGGASATALVSQLVGVDGTGSSDPEGDPLAFTWTLAVPAGSAAVLEDAAAQSALFTPDVRGAYTVTLVVRDSLDQESAPAVVIVEVLARFEVRARVRWASGGDVDVHLVESGSAPFGARDARFDNRIVAAGDPGSALDDAVLLDDATSAPGLEEVVLEVPAAGTWEVWAHVFDDAGLGAVTVDVDAVFDDEAPPAATASEVLPATCAAWHAMDIVVAADGTKSVVAVDAPVLTLCPP